MVRSRYAPSPTGYMTIGNLRSALYEYLIAKREGGVFILRLEDTDRQRYVEGAEEAIYKTLRRTGLRYDEGPLVGGDYGPYIQSQRKASYLPHALELVEGGKAYFCFCEKERLDSLADERGLKKYDRHCLALSPEEIKQRLEAGTAYVIRQRIPEGRTAFRDTVFGEIAIENKEMEDQILIKSDGMPTYNFANVVDDHHMAITHVVRGCEYITSTPKYVLLYEALGWPMPVFVHLPLLQNEEGQKISKRHGAASIIDMLEAGFLPEAIINYVALLGWSPAGAHAHHEIFTLPELEKIFDPAHISKSPSTFDIKKLTWMNSEHIKKMKREKFHALVIPFLDEAAKKPGRDFLPDIHALADMAQPRLAFPREIVPMVDFFFTLPAYDIELYTHAKMKTDPEVALGALTAFREAFSRLADGEKAVAEAMAASGLGKGQLLWSLRTALSGMPATPCGALDMVRLLSKEETLRRLDIGIEKLTPAVK
ncbi:MAG: glutamate--tRNA ligase [Defluviitaleaceae bacterium]|nr:glutamate--tRNA ligase [Defluviitaleaceae bacterium]MCL2238541.1 glutamate--tRNA ligase [Defluviitaleaceae bacterium]